MAEDMMSTLKGLLGDGAEEKIQSVLSALGDNNSAQPPQEDTQKNISPKSVTSPSITPEMLQYIGQFKGMIDDMGRANDSRSSLLLALKPYMRTGRQKSIDNAVKLLNISKMTGLFK